MTTHCLKRKCTLATTGEEATGYIAACTGGTHAPKKNMVIGLEEDLTSLEFYNRSLYDVDEACYAKFLPSDKYEIVDYKIQINAGERTGRTMIKIRPEGLSPDSTYFVGLKAKTPFYIRYSLRTPMQHREKTFSIQ